MRKVYLAFLIIGILYILQIPMTRDYVTSVVPGWHVTILPPYMIGGILTGLWIFVLTGAYYTLAKRKHQINKTMFVAHLLLTMPWVAFFMLIHEILAYTLIKENDTLLDFTFYICAPMFIIGQLIFVAYFIQSLRSRITKG